jgi:hypothetical protein
VHGGNREAAVYVEEDPGGPDTDGWTGAAVLVVVVSAAVMALMSVNWSGPSGSDELYRANATRQLVMVPLPR